MRVKQRERAFRTSTMLCILAVCLSLALALCSLSARRVPMPLISLSRRRWYRVTVRSMLFANYWVSHSRPLGPSRNQFSCLWHSSRSSTATRYYGMGTSLWSWSGGARGRSGWFVDDSESRSVARFSHAALVTIPRHHDTTHSSSTPFGCS